MSVAPERVAAIAAAARVPLREGAAERIAQAIAPAVERFRAHPPDFAFETEPATFVTVAQRDRAR